MPFRMWKGASARVVDLCALLNDERRKAYSAFYFDLGDQQKIEEMFTTGNCRTHIQSAKERNGNDFLDSMFIGNPRQHFWAPFTDAIPDESLGAIPDESQKQLLIRLLRAVAQELVYSEMRELLLDEKGAAQGLFMECEVSFMGEGEEGVGIDDGGKRFGRRLSPSD